MADTKRIAGTCYIKVNGAQIPVEGSVEYPLRTTTREAKIGSTGVVGYSETPITPFLRLTALLPADFPIDDILEDDDMTITAELANGWVYTLSDAWLSGEVTASGSDGTSTLEFNGLDCHLDSSSS